jgi:hypothetical protein
MNASSTITHGVLVVLSILSFPAVCMGDEMPLVPGAKVSAEIALSNKTGASDKAAIDAVANKLLKKEIELQELNEQLHLEAATINFNRLRRTWLWDFGNAIPTEAGLIGAAALYYSRAHDKIQRSVQTKTVSGKILYSLQAKKGENYAPASDRANTIIPQIAGQEDRSCRTSVLISLRERIKLERKEIFHCLISQRNYVSNLISNNLN